jgi:hypothetical protein
LQSPEAETKGVLLDDEGVTSKRGGTILTCIHDYHQAVEAAGTGQQGEPSATAEEDFQARAAVSGV